MSSLDDHLLSSFFTILIIAIILIILAFIAHGLFTESTRVAAEKLVRQRQPAPEKNEKHLANLHDSVVFYDHLVRN